MGEQDLFECEERLVEEIAKYKSFCEQEGVDFEDGMKVLIERASE